VEEAGDIPVAVVTHIWVAAMEVLIAIHQAVEVVGLVVEEVVEEVAEEVAEEVVEVLVEVIEHHRHRHRHIMSHHTIIIARHHRHHVIMTGVVMIGIQIF
jgi:phage replication-related protein YjqB (UPF0714/DUF867 family)